MINAELLNQAGISYEAGMNRFMNDIELFEAVLSAFLDEDILERAAEAYKEKNHKKLLMVIHEAKGSSGNAGLDKLYEIARTLVKLLRSPSFTEEELRQGYEHFVEAYTVTKTGINAAIIK